MYKNLMVQEKKYLCLLYFFMLLLKKMLYGISNYMQETAEFNF